MYRALSKTACTINSACPHVNHRHFTPFPLIITWSRAAGLNLQRSVMSLLMSYVALTPPTPTMSVALAPLHNNSNRGGHLHWENMTNGEQTSCWHNQGIIFVPRILTYFNLRVHLIKPGLTHQKPLVKHSTLHPKATTHCSQEVSVSSPNDGHIS